MDAKQLIHCFKCNQDTADLALDLIKSQFKHQHMESVLQEVCTLFKCKQVGRLNGKRLRGYWGPCRALYLDRGLGEYEPTLVYDTCKRQFHLTSWGKWFESYAKAYKLEATK